MAARLQNAGIALGAAAALLVAGATRASVAGIFQAALAFMLCCIAAHDIETRRIENATVLAIVLLHLYEIALAGFAAGEGLASTARALAAGALDAAIVLAILLATAWICERATGRAGIGGGDVKLLSALGFSLGWETGLAIAGASCLLLVLVSALPRRRAAASTFAFAPFIAVSTLLALLAL